MSKLLQKILAAEGEEETKEVAPEAEPAEAAPGDAEPEVQEQAIDATKYLEPFELDKKTLDFIAEHGFEDQIVKDEEGDVATLNEATAQELAKTFATFEKAQSDDHGLAESLKETVIEIGKEVAPNFTFDVEVTAEDESLGNPAHWMRVTLKKGSAEKELESVLYYTYEPGLNLAEGAESWNWAAWLGLPDSPFYDETFVEMYDENQVGLSMGEMLATLNESQDKLDIEKAIKSFEKEYEPIYTYVIDHDERGEFRATVRDENDETVYQVGNNEDGEIEQVEDGFMRNKTDIAGLQKHLRNIDIIPKNGIIEKG